PRAVASHKICTDKKHGGLGLINNTLFNKAAMGMYVWYLASKADHLWIHWVSNVYLKRVNYYLEQTMDQGTGAKADWWGALDCFLCANGTDDVDHLFLKCDLSNRCVCLAAKWLGINPRSLNCWQRRMKCRTGSVIKRQVYTAVVEAICYKIWVARNSARFSMYVRSRRL
ncbi:hypothetical protein RND81_07G032700, partial [Saponaria officinalis]